MRKAIALTQTHLTPDGDLADPYRGFIAKSRYARWRDADNRRETWTETVDRYMGFMQGHLMDKYGYVPASDLYHEIRQAILNHQVMPSMRALMTAGEALHRSNIAGFNCSYLPLQDPQSLDELLYILMNGTGVGYSVERKYVDQLPAVPATIGRFYAATIMVSDSKEGWAYALRSLLRYLWNGVRPEWNLSAVRPAGARLATFGGRASGPEPLAELFEYVIELFLSARGRQLRPIEVHDLACKIASVVVVGGVRRSAMIALSDVDDTEMAEAKSGRWWESAPHRALANISAVYTDEITRTEFDHEWENLVNSGSGERGIFHRGAAQRQAAKFGYRAEDVDYGTNPCSEIILRPYSFCNLTEVVVRPADTLDSISRKAELAAILGTWQATLTDYPYLRDEWRQNAESERLLGVSLTGVFGNAILGGKKGHALAGLALVTLRAAVRRSNADEARRIGIPAAAAATCVKPSGTVSQLVGCESGLHPRHAQYYLRRVRIDKKDPLGLLLLDSGVPAEEDAYNSAAWVFEFPQRAAKDAVTRADLSALDHLKLWRIYQEYWCEHKPSVTVSVRPEEWDEVREWVWEHLGSVSGVSFLPYAEHTYVQPPYEEISEESYWTLVSSMPEIFWHDLTFYELADGTTGSQELACSAAGDCEVVDLLAA